MSVFTREKTVEAVTHAAPDTAAGSLIPNNHRLTIKSVPDADVPVSGVFIILQLLNMTEHASLAFNIAQNTFSLLANRCTYSID